MDTSHRKLVPNYWDQYLPDPGISMCMHFIYIGFCYCSEWIGIL